MTYTNHVDGLRAELSIVDDKYVVLVAEWEHWQIKRIVAEFSVEASSLGAAKRLHSLARSVCDYLNAGGSWDEFDMFCWKMHHESAGRRVTPAMQGELLDVTETRDRTLLIKTSDEEVLQVTEDVITESLHPSEVMLRLQEDAECATP